MTLIRYQNPLATFRGFARSPWAGLENEFDRLFQSAAGDRFPVDIFEDGGNAYVRAELPGVKRESIGVEVADGYLTLGVARNADEQKLTRSIRLPDEVQADKVSAAYENGVLTVTLPKREEAKPRKVNVEVK